jgi:uncharacterized protein
MVADRSGAVYWPDEQTLIVADLHLEKGSFYATRGVMLPPYDTKATLAALAEVIRRYDPARVIALGDSFHDHAGGKRLTDENRAAVNVMQAGREWHWISGNHDPERIEGIHGIFSNGLSVRGLYFRHQPAGDENEVVGHFHPVASISARGRTMRLRCFAGSFNRLVLPAFGTLTGGLDVRASAFAEILGLNFLVHVWAADRFCSFPVRARQS